MSDKKSELKIEESFSKLDEILEKMENEDTGLEEAFKLYEEGLKLVKTTESSIDKVEKQIQILKEK